MVQGQEFRERKTRQIRTDIKQTTLTILLEAVYCQEVHPFSFYAACDLLQVRVFFWFYSVDKPSKNTSLKLKIKYRKQINK